MMSITGLATQVWSWKRKILQNEKKEHKRFNKNCERLDSLYVQLDFTTKKVENQQVLGLSVLLRVSECAHTLVQHHYTRHSDLIAQLSHASQYCPAEGKEYLRCVSTTGFSNYFKLLIKCILQKNMILWNLFWVKQKNHVWVNVCNDCE